MQKRPQSKKVKNYQTADKSKAKAQRSIEKSQLKKTKVYVHDQNFKEKKTQT